MARLPSTPHAIGGGTRIGESLATFNRWHSRRVINSRTAVMIVSDGYDTGEPDAISAAIAAHIAPFIEDGAALQVGLGKVPAAVMRLLHDRRRLRLQSGMLSDGAPATSQARESRRGKRGPSCDGASLAGTPLSAVTWDCRRRMRH